MGKWSGWPLVRADVAEADATLNATGRVNAREWAALVWAWTNVPTADEFYEIGKETPVGLGLHDGERRVWYYAPAVIAHQTGPWVQAVGYHRMREWITLLEDTSQQQRAWNYLHGQFTDYAPEEDRPELVRARVDGIREQIKQVTGHLTLVTVEE